jgi:ribA/ribD-fused uncharacterized protein
MSTVYEIIVEKPITRFRETWSFLSNFFPAPVALDGKIYPTIEHAYQAAKTVREKERKVIRQAPSPAQAKRLGQRVALRPDWEQVKLDIMLDLLHQKFQDPGLHRKLLATGNAPLIEGNHWGDRFLGCVPGSGPGQALEKGRWVGKNHRDVCS